MSSSNDSRHPSTGGPARQPTVGGYRPDTLTTPTKRSDADPNAAPQLSPAQWEANKARFHDHYERTYRGRHSWEELEPAYRLGQRLAQQGAARSDVPIENTAQQEWTLQNSTLPWEAVRDAWLFGYRSVETRDGEQAKQPERRAPKEPDQP